MRIITEYNNNRKSIFTVWDITDNNGYATVNMSENRKVREDNSYDANLIEHGVSKNGYIATNWNYVRFVGHAYNKLKGIQSGDRIAKISGELNCEPYYGDTNAEVNEYIKYLEKRQVIVSGGIPYLDKNYGVVYPRRPRLTIFDFETVADAEAQLSQTNTPSSNNMDKAPKVEIAEQSPIFNQPATPAQPVKPITPIKEVQTSVSDELPF